MADARTERTAAILLDQFDGALRRAIDDIHRTLARREFLPARQKIDALLSRSSLGQHLVRAWRVVLAGRPNVGKSSLMNALAGHQRSIVHHEPGTTRDAVTLDTAIDGWPVQLCDTAGLRQANDDLESAGIELARQRLAKADLIVLVCDQSVPWSAADQTLLDQWPGALVVYNKCDLAVGTAATCGINYPPSGLQVSALRGDGIEPLLEAIARRLVPDSPPPGAAVPFMPEQAAEIRAMRELSE
ncbi:MAG: 50S ribosome-binding GTPase [Planctomycetaceae bacterium]|nr:50S ribosome-binding GTPase [Planctomycetaceae bacterium]